MLRRPGSAPGGSTRPCSSDPANAPSRPASVGGPTGWKEMKSRALQSGVRAALFASACPMMQRKTHSTRQNGYETGDPEAFLPPVDLSCLRCRKRSESPTATGLLVVAILQIAGQDVDANGCSNNKRNEEYRILPPRWLLLLARGLFSNPCEATCALGR